MYLKLRKSKFTLYYCGDNIKQGHRGVGLIVSKKASRSKLGLSPICSRIYTLRIEGTFRNITIVNVCSPTEDAENERVNLFYETIKLCVTKYRKMMLS